MIVKNEESCLEKCLTAVKDLVDEIIIVDTGSTDKTLEISQRFTDKTFFFEWCNDFSAARNFSLTKATKEWILFLDADEILAKDDHTAIRKLIERKDAIAYAFDQVEYTNDASLTGFVYIQKKDKHSQEFLGKVIVSHAIRLFRNTPNICFHWKIHESISPSLEAKGLTALSSGIIIHHYKNEKNHEFQQQKMLMYLKIGEEQIKATPQHPKPLYETGLIYYFLGRYRDAAAAFEKVIAMIPKKYSEDAKFSDMKRAYHKLARCYTKLNEFPRAISLYEKYNQLKPNESDALAELGLLHIKINDTEKAKLFFLRALEANPANILAAHNLSLLYIHLGQKEKAHELLQAIKEKYPNQYTYNTLGILAVQENKLTEAKDFFENGISLQQYSSQDITINLYINLIQLFIFQKEKKPAEKWLLQLKKFYKGDINTIEKTINAL